MEAERIRRGVISWTVVGLLGTAFGIFKWLVVSRTLSSSDIGIYALLSVYAQFGSRFSGLGLSSALLHFDDVKESELNSALAAVLFTSAILAGSLLLLVFEWEGSALTAVMAVISLGFILRAVDDHFQTINARQSLHQVNAAANALGVVVGEGLTVALVLARPSVMSLAVGLTVMIAMQTGVKAGYQIIGQHRRFHNFAPLSGMAHLFRFSFWQLLGSLSNLFTSRVDRVIIASGFGLEAVGYFEIASQMAMRPYQFLGTVIGQVLTPALSNRKHVLEQVNSVYMELRETLVELQLPVYLFLFVYADLIMRVVYDVHSNFAEHALRALAILGFAKALVNPIGSYAIALGWSKIELTFNVIMGIAYAALLAIGIWINSSVAAIWAYGIGGAVCLLILDTKVRKKVSGMDRGRILGLRQSTTLSLSLAIGLSFAVSYTLTRDSELLRLLAIALVYGGFYAVLERARLRKLMIRFWRKPNSSIEVT